jgi:hypothetical protein
MVGSVNIHDPRLGAIIAAQNGLHPNVENALVVMI